MRILAVISCIVCSLTLAYAFETVYMYDRYGDCLTTSQYIGGSAAVAVEVSENSHYTGTELDCTITLYGDYIYEDKLMVQFTSLSLTGDYDDSYVQLYDGRNTRAPMIGYKVCDTSIPSYRYTTTGSYLTIRFMKKKHVHNWSFSLLLTHFHKGSCRSYEHRCNNGRCIDDDLVCSDHKNPCGDATDPCIGTTVAIIVGSVVGSVMFIIITVVIVVIVCLMKRRRLQARRQPPPTFIMQPMATVPMQHPQYQITTVQATVPQPVPVPQPAPVPQATPGNTSTTSAY